MRKKIIKVYSALWRVIRGVKNFIAERYDSLLFSIDLSRADVFPEVHGQRVCIIVPHVDDDILGMGGLLTALDSNGNDILIVYTTDGCKSYHPDYNEEIMKQKREEEAEEVRKEFINVRICLLGNKSMEWDIECAKKQLSKQIVEFAPQFIFFPSAYDRNLDHVKNAICLGKSIGNGFEKTRFFSFSVQTPIMQEKISHYYLMSKTEKRKKVKCLGRYQSQEVMAKSFDKVILFNELCVQDGMGTDVCGLELFEEFSIERIRGIAHANISELHRDFPILTYGTSIRRVNKKCSMLQTEK